MAERSPSQPPVGPAGGGPRSAREWGRRGLTTAGHRVALAAVEAVLAERRPDGQLAAPEPASCERIVDGFQLAIGSGSPGLRSGVRVMLTLLDVLPPLVVRRWRRMTRLPLAERVAYLQALEDSRMGVLAMLVVGVKIPMAIYAFEQGDGLRMTGFDRPSTTSARQGRVGPQAVAPSRAESLVAAGSCTAGSEAGSGRSGGPAVEPGAEPGKDGAR